MAKQRTLKVRNYLTLDVTKLVPKLREELGHGIGHNPKTAEILSDLWLFGRKFSFFWLRRGFSGVIYVRCSGCGCLRSKLLRVEGEFKCRDCHAVCTPTRLHPRPTRYPHLVRPLQHFLILKQKLDSTELTQRQRAMLLNKIERLSGASPHALWLLGHGQLKVELPPYAVALGHLL